MGLMNDQDFSNVSSAKRDNFVVALVGQPNSGKTTVFNFLTGLNQHVGNWPGKTVSRHEGSLVVGNHSITIVDIPGLYSMTSASEEERIAENFIISDHPDLLLVVGNASCLERSLFFLQEVSLLGRPIIFLLNMIDVATQHGIAIDISALSEELEIPVIPIVARTGRNLEILKKAIEDFIAKPKQLPLKLFIDDKIYSDINTQLTKVIPEFLPSRWLAYKLVQNSKHANEIIAKYSSHLDQQDIIASVSPGVDDSLRIISTIYERITAIVGRVVVQRQTKVSFVSDWVDRLVTHHVWGLGVLISIFALVFFMTFYVAAPVQELLDHRIIIPVRASVKAFLSSTHPFFASLIADGLIAGAGMVLTFLPVLMLFYIALALLEDTGYLARVAYVMDRFMQVIGLHGKTALPLFMAFGCNVPAVMGTRVIESRIGRLVTIFLAPLIPCSARLTVLFYLAPIFFGVWAPLIAIGLLILNIGVVLGRIFFQHSKVSFLMELPTYHFPSTRTVFTFVYQHLCQFLKNAATVILLFSVFIWFLSNYPGTTIEDSYLGFFGRLVEPLAVVMGFDWRMVVALLASFFAKENSIATLGILYGQNEAGSISSVIHEEISPLSALSFLVVSMLFIPCIATVAAVKQESRSWLWTILNILVLAVIAFGAGVLTYQVGRLSGYGQ